MLLKPLILFEFFYRVGRVCAVTKIYFTLMSPDIRIRVIVIDIVQREPGTCTNASTTAHNLFILLFHYNLIIILHQFSNKFCIGFRFR